MSKRGTASEAQAGTMENLVTNDNKPLRNAFSTHFTAAEVHEVLSAQFTVAEIAAGKTAMSRFSPHVSDGIQEVNVLARLVSEASVAAKAIDKKMMAISFYAGGGDVPGLPQGGVQYGGGAGLGFYQVYENGAIFWRRDLGACWVHGAIYDKYRALKAEAGFLGYPETDETGTADGKGRFNHFERGSIYWHPATGAFEVHGEIRAKWQALGSEAFGYPVTDETATAGGQGRFNHFQDVLHGGTAAGASIYWSQDTGAHVVRGAIRNRWAELGWENSYLGYPVTDEGGWTDPETQNTGLVSHFQRGAIAWTADTQDVVEFPERIILSSGPIGVSSVGGWVELVLTSAGTFNYRGHLHNSGFVGLGCTVASGVKIAGTTEALMAMKEVNVGGTASFDDRDEDWDDSGYAPQIRAHWDILRQENSMTTDIKAALGAADFFLLVFLPLIGALTVFTLVSGGSPPDTHCETSGMHTVKDGNNNTIAEPSGVRCGLPGPPR
jgi:uncharacterized protein with LGFP repeats